jgi:hypothetical protein
LGTNRSRQAIIGRQQLALQLLGKRDVRSVIGREIRPELKHPSKQRLMSVAKERQIQIVLEGIRGSHGIDPPREQAPPKSRCHLDVAERRRVEVGVGRL